MERAWHRVGRRQDIESGALRRVQIHGVRWVGLHPWNGRIYALEDVCPHWGVPLSDGCILPDGKIECGLHGWTFDLATGAGIESSMGAIECYEVDERDGEIFVREAVPIFAGPGPTLRGSGI
jgi:nitrite reductase/ring-hydroxylating ferredoxin subunit